MYLGVLRPINHYFNSSETLFKIVYRLYFYIEISIINLNNIYLCYFEKTIS